MLYLANVLLLEFGIDVRKFVLAIKGSAKYLTNLVIFFSKSNGSSSFTVKKIRPCLSDRYDNSGVAKGHYFHQDLLIAQKIFQKNPRKHIDFGSRVDGFVAHVASFRNIEIFDVRRLHSKSNNITFKQVDAMNIPEIYYGYTDSLSCLHTLEHIGLGRYGDNIDRNGHIKALKNLVKVLKWDGILYLSFPIGKQRIEFDAHRVFSVKYAFKMFEVAGLAVQQISYVDDDGNLHNLDSVKISRNDIKTNFNCNYGCGIFELKKIKQNDNN